MTRSKLATVSPVSFLDLTLETVVLLATPPTMDRAPMILATFLPEIETPDSDGQSLLESTVVMFGSGMGNASSHSSRNLPIMVAGGGFRNGNHHRFERQGRDGRPLSDLFVTILQQLGVERERFATSTNNLNDLLI